MKTNQLKKLAIAVLAITALMLVSSCAESENVKGARLTLGTLRGTFDVKPAKH